MKIAKQSNEYNAIMKILSVPLPLKAGPRDLATFKFHQDEKKIYTKINHKTAGSLHKAGFHDWVRIDKYAIEDIFGKNHLAFEAFVQGYISYFEKYDSFIGNDDRIIYFDWNPKSDHDLIIYLKPLYARNYNDYKTPMSHFPFSNPPTVVDPPPVGKIPPPTGK
ncbi:MAG: hypothetical protein ABUT20_48230 [Bacteroidota bacterium]